MRGLRGEEERGRGKMNENKESICQTCFNFNCEWHEHFKPVDGWTATPTKIRDMHGASKVVIDSYFVENCPCYKERGRGIKRITTQEISKAMGWAERTTAHILQRPALCWERYCKIVDYYDKQGFEIVVGENGKGNIYYTIKKEQKK